MSKEFAAGLAAGAIIVGAVVFLFLAGEDFGQWNAADTLKKMGKVECAEILREMDK